MVCVMFGLAGSPKILQICAVCLVSGQLCGETLEGWESHVSSC